MLPASPTSRHVWQRAPLGLALGCGLLAATASSACFAGAWTQSAGDTLLIVKYLHNEGSEQFDDAHHREDFTDHGRSRQEQLNLYLEHGLSDRLSVVGNFYLSQVAYRNDYGSDRTSGLADQELGLRWALGRDLAAPWRQSAQALVSIPAYDRDDQPALGHGDYGMELRYSAGRGYTLGSRSGYVDLGVAVRLRGADASDEARFDLNTGLALSERWMMIGELNVIQGLGNGRANVDYDTYTVSGTNYDLTKLQLSALYTAGGMQWQLGYQQPVMGRNTSAAGGPFVAAWWRF